MAWLRCLKSLLMVLLSSSSVFDSSTETYFSPCLGDLVLLGDCCGLFGKYAVFLFGDCRTFAGERPGSTALSFKPLEEAESIRTGGFFLSAYGETPRAISTKLPLP